MKLKFFSKKRGKGELTPDEQAAEFHKDEQKLEKGDAFAMIVSAFVTLFLPTVLVLVGMVLILLWIGGAL